MKKKESSRIWDYLAWVVLSLILLWTILKILGVIHSPLIVEYAPFLGAVYLAGWAMHKLDRATEDIGELRRDMRYSEKRAGKIENRLGIVESDISVIRGDISRISERMGTT